MNTRYNFLVISALALCILFCVGIYLSAQWDYQRFAEGLGKPPRVSHQATKQRETAKSESTGPIVPAAKVESEDLQGQRVKQEASESDFSIKAPEDIKAFEDFEFNDSSLSDSDLPEEFVEEVSLDKEAKVQVGFDDYNTFLSTDPERAYASLAEALREQYGDSSEVDTFVETIKWTNEGTLTIDDAITQAETLSRLQPASASESLEALQIWLETLHEFKELEAMGDNVELEYRFQFGE